MVIISDAIMDVVGDLSVWIRRMEGSGLMAGAFLDGPLAASVRLRLKTLLQLLR